MQKDRLPEDVSGCLVSSASMAFCSSIASRAFESSDSFLENDFSIANTAASYALFICARICLCWLSKNVHIGSSLGCKSRRILNTSQLVRFSMIAGNITHSIVFSCSSKVRDGSCSCNRSAFFISPIAFSTFPHTFSRTRFRCWSAEAEVWPSFALLKGSNCPGRVSMRVFPLL